MKALFINLGTKAVYGATRSLSELTKKWPEKFDMIVPYEFPKDFFNKKDKSKHLEEARESYGNNLRYLYFFWLPQKFPIYMEHRDTIKWKLKHQVFVYILGVLNKRKIFELIEKNNYDFIHLNSLTLYPLLSKKYNMYLHVRCIMDRDFKRVSSKIKDAKGIVFIEESVMTPFEAEIESLNYIKLINPFDMTRVNEIDTHKVREQLGITEEETIYMIAGNVSSLKGVDFVIKAFKDVAAKTRLLVVGDGDEDFCNYCRELAKGDNRILFVGEWQDMTPLYAISDYVVRGDCQFGFGRTCYESLLSGKGIIVPGSVNDAPRVQNYDLYKDRIFFYEPRNIEALKSVVNISTKYKQRGLVAGKNTEEYYQNFMQFVTKSKFRENQDGV